MSNISSKAKTGRGAIAFLFATHFFLLMTAYYQIKPLSRTLYIHYVGASNLPIVWIATTLVLTALIPFFHWRLKRFRPVQAIVSSVSSFIALLIVFRLTLSEPTRVSAFCFYLLVDTYSVILIENFWGLVSGSFNIDSGKKWYGFIASGGLLGGFFGSYFAAFLLNQFSGTPTNLIYITVIFLLLYLMMTPLVSAYSTANPRDADSEEQEALHEHRPYMRNYFWIVAFILLMAQLVEPVVEYIFLTRIEREIPTLHAQTEYLSKVFGYLSSFALGINLLVLPLLYRVMGVAGGLILQPVLIMGMALFYTYLPTLQVASTLKILDRSLAYSIGRATREVLYLGFSERTVFIVKTWIDVYGYRVFKILGSVLILIFTRWLTLSPLLTDLAMIIIVFASFWIVALIFLKDSLHE